MPRKVLLGSIDAGAGHNALRDSFLSVLRRFDPEHRVFDPESWTSADSSVQRFYEMCVHHLTRLQGTVYELTSEPWAMEVGSWLTPRLQREARALIEKHPFDVVVATHPMLTQALGRARAALGVEVPLITAVPDYGAPTTAYFPPASRLQPDFLVVMGEDTLAHYRGIGLPEERLHLSGFLTREAFARVGHRLRSEPRAQLRAALRDEVAAESPGFATLKLDRPTLLFLGGSAWTKKTEPVLRRVLADGALRASVNVVVVCGRDRGFQEALEADAHAGVHVFGYVSPAILAALMGLSDVPVLGSLAPATLQELLETELGPLLLFHYIPGSERSHVSHIEARRLGVYEPDPPAMLQAIREAVGMARVSPRIALCKDGFRDRARELRARSVERAMALPGFLARVCNAEQRQVASTSAAAPAFR
jgi:UDP-N-acetylglucosamine:LPS N-acetylglucosamine transferase